MHSISSQIMANEAKKMGFKIKVYDSEHDIFKIYFGDKKSCMCKNIDCGLNSGLGVRFSSQKQLTYVLLKLKNIKVPNSVCMSKSDIYDFKINESGLQYPLVVKPSKGEHGDGVSVNIKNETELMKGLKKAGEFSKNVIVQEFFKGEDFRIIVINHKFVAAIKRVPAHIVGDGKHTWNQLIEIENDKSERGDGHEKSLSKIFVDDDSIAYAKEQGYKMDDISIQGKTLYIRRNANLSTGGLSIDVSDSIHPEIIKMCEKASRAVQLQVCGIDYLSEDITKPLKEQSGGIIEINSTPGLRGHHMPFIGKPRNVAKKILQLAYKTHHG